MNATNFHAFLNIIQSFIEKIVAEGFLCHGKLEYEASWNEELLSSWAPVAADFIRQLQNSFANDASHETVTLTSMEHEVAKTEAPLCDTQFVQIKADLKEIKRRIGAFITRKRMEVDEINLQEFCNRPRAGFEENCARVDAVLVKRAGTKSHVKVSRVENKWGPQIHPVPSTTVILQPQKNENQVPRNPASTSVHASSVAVEERIGNMETHLKVKSGQSVSKDVYERLRNLENRILFLEGLSPDYFESSPAKLQKLTHSHGSGPVKRGSQDLSLAEIEVRIQALRQSLQNKQQISSSCPSTSSST